MVIESCRAGAKLVRSWQDCADMLLLAVWGHDGQCPVLKGKWDAKVMLSGAICGCAVAASWSL